MTTSRAERNDHHVLFGALALVQTLLLAVFPLLSLFSQNEAEVPLSVLWWPLILCLGSTAVIYGLLVVLTKNALKAAALTSLAALALWYYGIFSDKLSGTVSGGWFTGAWLVVFAGLAIVLARTHRSLSNLTLILLAAAAALTLPQIFNLARYQLGHRSPPVTDARWWPSALAAPHPHNRSRLPDIYMLIPDDYARPDVLKRYFHYGDAAFIQQLKQRGFTIARNVRSPYSDSESNTAAELNLDYLSSFPKVLGAKSQDVRPVKRAEQDNRAARLLRPLGYRYLHLDTDEVTFAGSNPAISPLAPPDSFANLWLRKSILSEIGGPLGFSQKAMNNRFRSSIRSQFARLLDVARQPGPKFVVFHTLLPHDPYVLGAHGQPVTFDPHSDSDLASTRGRQLYLAQLKGLNRRLIAAVDAIRAQSRRPAVIAIQSDEGFQANPETWGERVMTQLRVKGFMALHLPGARTSSAVSPPNTVNTLRYVFNRYLGTQYPMLPSASYPEGDYPYQYEAMKVK